MTLEFKYQTLFTCSVPINFKLIKDFNEMVASDQPLTLDDLTTTISLSLEQAKLEIKELTISNDLGYCDVLLKGATEPIRIIIRSRPSLVYGDQIFKLQEFDI